MSPWAARPRGPGHTVRFCYLEWRIQSVNLEVLQYMLARSRATLARARADARGERRARAVPRARRDRDAGGRGAPGGTNARG